MNDRASRKVYSTVSPLRPLQKQSTAASLECHVAFNPGYARSNALTGAHPSRPSHSSGQLQMADDFRNGGSLTRDV